MSCARAAWPVVAAGLALGLAPGTSSAQVIQPRNEVAFYVEQYGEIPPRADPQVARAFRVFERVRAVADKSSKRLPRLVVVDSDGDPWAITLPDGHIVVSRQAVRICHQLRTQADACLAFVLGHELAHLANDDFWHREVHGFLASGPDARRIAGFLRGNRRARTVELAADDKGYIFAAMAGYRVGALLDEERGEPGFFERWVEQTNSRVTGLDASPGVRAAVLRQRLVDVDRKLDFFHFGTWLAHFDYCDDGVYFLREFQKVFPGREVLNNLGYCYLQMARQAMAPERAYFYWMPRLLDGETRAAALVGRGERSLKMLRQATHADDDELLQRAAEYLSSAARADPGYLPARVNLAVTNLYLGMPHRARAVVEEALRLAPDDPEILALAALTLYEQGDVDVDLWPRAVSRLEALAAQHEDLAMARYNLARLLQVRGRSADARGHWNALAAKSQALPAPVRAMVCRAQGLARAGSCARPASSSTGGRAWRWPLRVDGFERLTAALVESHLAGWDETAFDWLEDKLHGRMYRRPDGGAAVLELDGFVHMQMLEGDGLPEVEELSVYCALPMRRRAMANATVWSCGTWAALVRDRRVEQLWWVAG